MPRLCAKTGYRVYVVDGGNPTNGIKLIVKPDSYDGWLFKFMSNSDNSDGTGWQNHIRLSHEHVLRLGWIPFTGKIQRHWLK